MPGAAPTELPSATAGDDVELSIVVMFTHDPGLARTCLAAVAAASEELPLTETIVILNASTQAVRDVVFGEFNGATVIDSPVNTGTAVAWQLGFTVARGRFVLLLHEDAQIQPGMTTRLLDLLRSEPSAGAAGPWLDESGPQRKNINAGWLRFGVHGARLTPGDLPPGLADDAYAVAEISSAASLWRRSAWEAIGGFEERTYPAISVEADSFAGLWARGFSVLVDPEARCVHATGTMAGAPGLLSGPHLRHFLFSRFEKLWAEKWAGADPCFTDFEIKPDDEVPQAEIELALARAQERRTTLPVIEDPPRSLRPITNPRGAAPAPTAVDAEIAERLRAAEREVTDDYTRWLIARDTEMTRRYDEVSDAYNKLGADAEQYRRDFDSVVESRRWKLGAALRKLRPTRRS